jgi:hypothetical protein
MVTGIRAVTVVPWPGVDLIENLPPTISNRSLMPSKFALTVID